MLKRANDKNRRLLFVHPVFLSLLAAKYRPQPRGCQGKSCVRHQVPFLTPFGRRAERVAVIDGYRRHPVAFRAGVERVQKTRPTMWSSPRIGTPLAKPVSTPLSVPGAILSSEILNWHTKSINPSGLPSGPPPTSS